MSEAERSFPRRSAVTRRFTLGRPRSFAVAADGSSVAFLRSDAGDDPVNHLWLLDVESGRERQVADALALLAGADEDLPAAERARRERARESAGGIVEYAANPTLTVAAFALGGRLFVADLRDDGAVRELAVGRPVFDPRPDPTGRLVAYVSDRALRVVGFDGGGDREVAGESDANISWSAAEFIAAEEMDRRRGYWWSPDGSRLLAARVDIGPVQRWHVADASDPGSAPKVLAYPAAGTPNADVGLAVFDANGGASGSGSEGGGSPREVEWDRKAFPYLVTVNWSNSGPPLLVVQSRDQRRMQVLSLDPETGETRVQREDHDDAWLEIVPGVPAWTDDGRLVWAADSADTRRLIVEGDAVTPPGLQVREVLDVAGGILFAASEDPTEQHIYRWEPDGSMTRLTDAPDVHTAVAGGGVTVVVSGTGESGSNSSGYFTNVLRPGREPLSIASLAEAPEVRPAPVLLSAGPRAMATALLLPSDRVPGGPPLPVLMDPYGGPHFARVTKAPGALLQSQWFADQGFAVIVADGRGTPGRGPAWERAVRGDLAGPPLEDQVEALHAVAETHAEVLDLSRVAIRGWSFGGFLAALAVLRRPDVFHAAVAGAPVTDWRLYDTHYTERYLGTPQDDPEAYERSSLLADAARLERPLMLIHGLADDNVVSAHTLRLSSALLAAGKPHTVLPLSGVTHMTPQEVVAANLLLLQVAFLRQALGLESRP